MWEKIDPDKLYSVKEAAQMLDGEVTEATIKEYCKSGRLAGRKIGPKRRWHVKGSALATPREEWGLDAKR